jgi:hypothetical protein
VYAGGKKLFILELMEGMRPAITPNEAMRTIAGIETEIMATGAVDTEPRAIENIRQKMLSKEISPLEAVRMARDLADSRQNYH